jgi:PhnB protein
MMKSASPYVFIDNCQNVMEYYQSIFGGDITNIQNKDDGRCLHAELHLGDSIIHFSDTFGKILEGDNVRITLECESEEEIRKVYDAVINEGKITAPLQDTFWGAIHANVVDKFGIGWLLNYQK